MGDFRTWVKYTESGSFPEVRRGFSVLRCNQCTAAPCVEICPVIALDKRPDGIVDVDPQLCIGCKSCTHACPYDAIYINESTGTAEKCHFCAHRTDRGLAPACAVVCPTEAIIPGDFHDPQSHVRSLAKKHPLSVRKPEAGTGPNVRYIDANPAGMDPGKTNLSQGFIWSEPPTGERARAQAWEAESSEAVARTTYDVPRSQLWGWRVSTYLWTKSIAAGVLPIALLGMALGAPTATPEVEFTRFIAAVVALAFLGVTGLLLITDLKRPERFLYIFLKPNWNSWLVRGSYIIAAYSAVLLASLFMGSTFLTWLTYGLGAWTAAYTASLLAQAKGRVLWMRKGLGLQLLAQAGLAGSGTLMIMEFLGVVLDGALTSSLPVMMGTCLALNFIAILLEGNCAPKGREVEYERAVRLVSHGPFARRHWIVGVGLGLAVPLCLIVFGPSSLGALAAVLALAGLFVEEDILVRAGQALPIS